MIIPTLLSERLTLRAPSPKDFDAIYAFQSSDRSKFVGGPVSRPAESWSYLAGVIGHWHMRGFGRWVITQTDGDDTALGIVGLHYPFDWPEPEIAWTLYGEAEGNGYAFEAARLARDYAYQTLDWTTAISCVAPENTRSRALAEKLGCRPDGTFEHDEFGTMHIWRHPSPAEVLA